jgi:hypothetical protein
LPGSWAKVRRLPYGKRQRTPRRLERWLDESERPSIKAEAEVAASLAYPSAQPTTRRLVVML